MYCGHCGRENPEQSTFCSHCGSPLQPESVFRDGNLLIVPIGAELPPNCVKCGKPAAEVGKTHEVSWHSPWIYFALLNILIYIILALTLRKKMRVAFPLCEIHARRYRQLRWWGTALIVFGPILTVWSAMSKGDELALLIWTGLLMAILGVGLLLTKPLRPTKITGTYGSFKGSGPGFLATLRDMDFEHPKSPRSKVAETQSTNKPGLATHKRSLQILAALALLMAVGLTAYLGARLAMSPSPPSPAPVTSNPFEKVTLQAPAVATILVYNQNGAPIGQGSGFVLTSDGIAATSLHVLENGNRAEARLGDGRNFQILRVHAYDEDNDLAIFQLGLTDSGLEEAAVGLPTVRLGSSLAVRIGDRIATISSPKGLANSVTDGLISAVRSTDSGWRVLQITAPVSPGSSGGPVFDQQGSVIGVATFQVRDGQNLNFAIPIEKVRMLLTRRENLLLSDLGLRSAAAKRNNADAIFERAMNRGFKFYEADQFTDALEQFLLALRQRPKEPIVHYDVAICLDQLGSEDKAAEYFYSYLLLTPKSDPDRPYAVQWLTSRGYSIP